MPALQMIITDVGRAAIVAADNAGTLPVVLNQAALGTGKWTPDATATALNTELKRINTVGGVAAADTLHVTITDDSADVYSLGEFGIYTDGGVLFMIYSNLTGITDKAAEAMLLLATDTILTGIAPGSVTITGPGFVNPPATETQQGVVELSTDAEALTLADPSKAIVGTNLAALKILREDVSQEYTAQKNFSIATLIYGANISWDLNTQQVASVVLTGDAILDDPTNIKGGGTYILYVIQDATGGRVLNYGPAYRGPNKIKPVLSTEPNAVDILVFISDGVHMDISMMPNYG